MHRVQVFVQTVFENSSKMLATRRLIVGVLWCSPVIRELMSYCCHKHSLVVKTISTDDGDLLRITRGNPSESNCQPTKLTITLLDLILKLIITI